MPDETDHVVDFFCRKLISESRHAVATFVDLFDEVCVRMVQRMAGPQRRRLYSLAFNLNGFPLAGITVTGCAAFRISGAGSGEGVRGWIRSGCCGLRRLPVASGNLIRL